MRVLIGSAALAEFRLIRRKPKDIDYFTDDIHYANNRGEDHTYIPTEVIEQIPCVLDVAIPNAVYTIKCSHLAWNKHWNKTKADVLYLRRLGCKLLPELYNALKRHWTKVNGDKDWLSLKQDKAEFFTDFVDYTYDHDYLHELVAYPQGALYKRCLMQGQEVEIDVDRFKLLSHDNQIRMFREEIAVIAIERWMIPSGVRWTKAYRLALKKTILSLTKGWACDFIISHLDEFVYPDYSYFTHAIETLHIKGNSMLGQKLLDGMLAHYKALSVDNEAVELEDFIEDVLVCGGYTSVTTWKDYYKVVVDESGGEGQGEDCHIVFKYKNKLYRADFEYYSHDGHNYDNFIESIREVSAVSKIVTVYE